MMVLIAIEDPGAANCILPVRRELAAAGVSAPVMVAGTARRTIHGEGVAEIQDGFLPDAGEVLQDYAPDAVLVGTSEKADAFGLQLIHAARLAGIASFAVIDAGTHAAFRFRGTGDNPLAFAPDHLFVSDEYTRKAYTDVGFNGKRVHVVGNPHDEMVRDHGRRLQREGVERVKRRILPTVVAERKVFVFVSEGTEKLTLLNPDARSTAYCMTGRGGCAGRTEIVIEEFLEAVDCLTKRPFTILRPHPKDQIGDYGDYAASFDAVDAVSSGLDLVFCADLVVGATSMLIGEAALMGKRTLAIIPRPEEKDWLFSVRNGLTPWVASREDLRRHLEMIVGAETAAAAAEEAVAVDGSPAVMVTSLIKKILIGSRQV